MYVYGGCTVRCFLVPYRTGMLNVQYGSKMYGMKSHKIMILNDQQKDIPSFVTRSRAIESKNRYLHISPAITHFECVKEHSEAPTMPKAAAFAIRRLLIFFLYSNNPNIFCGEHALWRLLRGWSAVDCSHMESFHW